VVELVLLPVVPSPYALSRIAVAGFVVFEFELCPYAALRIDVVGSTGAACTSFVLDKLNRSSTHCTVWFTAL